MCMTPTKGIIENISGVQDDDNSGDDVSMAPSHVEGRLRLFKVEAKVEVTNYDGIVNGEKLNAWLDKIETYFNLYNYSNAKKVTFMH